MRTVQWQSKGVCWRWSWALVAAGWLANASVQADEKPLLTLKAPAVAQAAAPDASTLGPESLALRAQPARTENVFSRPPTPGMQLPVPGTHPKALGGIAGQLQRARNPLQLLNPFAPPEYDGGRDNIVLDPFRNHPLGLAFLRISF